MKPVVILTALLGAVSLGDAHYTFDRLYVNGQQRGNSWTHILENTRREKYMPTKFINSFGTTPLDNDFRCNQGSFTSMGKTQVIDIPAGSEVSFQLAYGARMEHPGPGQVYMSRAPGSVKNYDGSGDWFKIYQTGLCRNVPNALTTTNWCTWSQDRITARIPKQTPNGEYLVRAEHIGLHGAHVGEAEFYYACALVRVTGGGNGTPGPLVKIPGVYQRNDPAVNFSVWSSGTTYPYIPGPAVWTGSGGSPPTQNPPPIQNPPPTNNPTPPPTGTVPIHGQCGGNGYTGATICASGSRCVRSNEWYSQCIP